MLKPALLALVAGSLSAVAPYAPDEPHIDFNAIARIDCGSLAGTAFWIARDRIITANHVLADHPEDCSIDGHPLTVVTREAGDIAELTGLENSHHLDVNCDGFREGRVYYAEGYALGTFRHSARMLATSQRDGGEPSRDGLVVLLGQGYQGMSGGPNVGVADHRVAGIINRVGHSQEFTESRALADTSICNGGRA